jgi:hypothetical protein
LLGIDIVGGAHARRPFFASEFLLTMARMTDPEIDADQEAEAKNRWRQARVVLLLTTLVILGLAMGLFFILSWG